MCQTWVAAVPLNHDGGALYLSKITDGDERVGILHIYIWDRSAMRQPKAVRLAARSLMRTNALERLLCEIDVDNKLAINLAKRVGVREIGIVRQRKNGNGGRHDVVAMDVLPGDLEDG